MAGHDIVVIGGSAGSTEVLKTLLSALPRTLEATLFVTTHVPADSPGLLARILARTAPLPVEQAFEGAPLRKGHIYVAVPDRHLIVTADGVRLGKGPRENMTRPSVDPMFRSAALAFGPRVVGVVLSGCLNDGASGLQAIRECGGIAVAQAEAEFPEMPSAASQATTIDYWALAGDLAPLILRLTAVRPGPSRPG